MISESPLAVDEIKKTNFRTSDNLLRKTLKSVGEAYE